MTRTFFRFVGGLLAAQLPEASVPECNLEREEMLNVILLGRGLPQMYRYPFLMGELPPAA